MLSIFPSLLSYQELSPLLIRLTLAITIGYLGYRRAIGIRQNHDKKMLACGIGEIILAIFILLGLFTQLAALIVAISLIARLVLKAKKKELLTDGVNYYLLLLIMSLSLLVTRAGWFGFDLPL